MSSSFVSQLPLAPLGAGDLIDRAVRLYRRHLFVLIRTAAPPVIVVAGSWILFSISVRRVFVTTETNDLLWYGFLTTLSLGLMFGGYLFMLVVMGGATRTLVAHLLRNEPVTARATYTAVKARFWGLLGASTIVMVWISASSMAAFMGGYMVLIVFVLGSVLFATAAPWIMPVVMLIGTVIASLLGLWIFFLIVGRVAYVPQVMLVEGKSVFAAVGRSFSLARGNVRRLMAMTLFTTFATYSALMILAIPLGWYGYLNGVDPLNSAQWPAWYAVAYSVLGPLSSIVLTPVWMLGLSLLYVDERVRHEGYDIELMAARQLGELPDVNVSSPLGTALHSLERQQPPPGPPMSSGRVLNLS
jgi:small-conductance mechanosensitive channel